MEGDRDEILANFQACTGIEDVALAFTHLEDTNWDLARAVNRAIPDQSVNRTNESSPDIEMIQEFINPNSNGRQSEESNKIEVDDEDDLVVVSANVPNSSGMNRIQLPLMKVRNNWQEEQCQPSTSVAESVSFIVERDEQSHKLRVSPYATVLELKKLIETQTHIKVCQQSITGWPQQPRNDSVTINTLGLGSLTHLRVRDTSDESVTDEVAEMITDTMLLGHAGLDKPNHSLSIKKRDSPTQDRRKSKKVQNKDESDDSSVEEFEDAAEAFNGDEDMFLPDTVSRKLRALIPDKVEDETVGCLHFADEFAGRYGPMHPEFFPGSLEDAINEACMKPAKERRLLALYLHHDRSVLSNVFCAQLLCSDSVINIFATYFVLWAWDLTYTSNQQRFIASFTQRVGSMAAMQIKSIPVERLPAIVIINRVRSNSEILSVIQGNVGIDELTASLSETVEVFMTQKNVEVREEEERTVRETIKQQQDDAFQESLEKDRAKDEARRHQEQVQVKEKMRELQQREHEAAEKEAERVNAQSRLPTEPPSTASEITKIRVRIPQGQPLERRFNESDSLQTLFDWLLVQGYRQNDIKLLSSWPRRDLTSVNSSLTLKELSLCPQETVILEEL